eukprot:sb/3467018/
MTTVNITTIEQVKHLLKHTGMSPAWYWIVLLINLTILITGLTGNLIVLIGSTRFKAIKVDAIMKYLIELVALTDILILILYFVPMFATLVAQRWALGSALCLATSMTSEVPFYMQVLLKTVASVYRLVKCRGWVTTTVRQQVLAVRIITALVFIISFAPLGFFITHNCNAIFVPEILRCISSQYSKKYGKVEVAQHSTYMTLVFIFVPTIIILVTNAWIWGIVRRSERNISQHSRRSQKDGEGKMNKTAIMLTVMCCSFVLCYIPTLVKFAMYGAGFRISLFLYLFHNYMLSAFLNDIKQSWNIFVKNFCEQD